MLKYKTCFPYEWLTKENIYNENLPSIENFYSSLKLDNISEKDYDKTLEIYRKLNCKNIKEYLDMYLKLDICLQIDIFNVFRKFIWDKFEIDCSKYITSSSLSLDLMLKYTGVKIELIRNTSIFDYVNSSILDGICISAQNIENDKNGVISSCDIASLYPYIMTKKLPIGNYRFIKYFNRNRYLNSDYSCLLNCEVYTTNKVKNNNTFKILANSLFGVMMTKVDKFKNFKIVTKESQVNIQVKNPNFSCRNIINENLTILEMEKTSVTYNYPILIGSIILQNSKVHMFNYLYKIYPRLFGNYKALYMDTDSIYAKLNISYEEYLKILEENKDLFGKDIGQNEPESTNNPIKEIISLSSKCYSYICKNDIENNKNK